MTTIKLFIANDIPLNIYNKTEELTQEQKEIIEKFKEMGITGNLTYVDCLEEYSFILDEKELELDAQGLMNIIQLAKDYMEDEITIYEGNAFIGRTNNIDLGF